MAKKKSKKKAGAKKTFAKKATSASGKKSSAKKTTSEKKSAKSRKAKPEPTFDPFVGFPIEMLHFLYELEANNNREWFHENKWRYEQQLLGPALRFINAMQEPLQKVSPHFVAVPKRTGGSLMRIYRDTRFSKEKTPYKTNVGIHFRHEKGKDVHAPGFYVHIEPEESFIGAGIWHPETDALNKIRKQIANRSDRWKKITSSRSFKSKFEQHGESLVRPPRGYDAEHLMIDELKRKDHILLAKIDTDDILSKGFVKKVASVLKSSSPYVEFLCDALRLKY